MAASQRQLASTSKLLKLCRQFLQRFLYYFCIKLFKVIFVFYFNALKPAKIFIKDKM